MAVGYRSSSSTGVGDNLTSSVAVPVPAGATANDIAVVAIEQWEAGNPTVTAPAGFTALTPVVSGSLKLKVFWKRLTGADAGDYTFTWSGAQWNQGQCILFTGVKTSGDPIGVNVNTATSASGTTVPSTSVTVAFQPGLGHFVANDGSATKTPATSFTEVQEGNYLASGYRIPGSTGTFSASGGTLSVSAPSMALLLALEPAGASGGPVALDGTATGANSAVGALSTTRALTGAASGSSGATGVLSRLRGFTGAASAASSASGNLSVARAFTGAAEGAGSVAAELTVAQPAWRLVMPAISERQTIRGNLAVTINREATVFGDENGLFTTQNGSVSEGSDDYGAIPFGTKYIWYGGHVNTTDDPAIKNLWLAHGFGVENVTG